MHLEIKPTGLISIFELARLTISGDQRHGISKEVAR